MTQPLAFLTLAALLATTLSAQGQQKYDIALKKAVQGETLLIDKIDVDDKKMTVVDNGKEVEVPNQGKKEYRYTYRQTILELPEGRQPTKLRRQYTKAEVISNNMTTTLPFQGKTLLIEKKEDKYRFQIEGGTELTGKDAEQLNEEFNQKKPGHPDLEKMMLPGRPVAVGTRWKVDTAPLVADLKREGGMVTDPDKFTVNVQLVKAYQKDGRQFGVLRVEMVVPIEAIAMGGKEKEMAKTPGSKMTLVADMDLCIDGSANIGTVKGQINMDLVVSIPGQQQRVTVTMRDTKYEQRQLPR